MSTLAESSCIPCRRDTPTVSDAERPRLLSELKGWEIVDDHHLQREFHFKDFLSALGWVNRIAALAEAESHHPDIYLAWGLVRVTIWSHAINNLSQSDFVLAAKIDQLFIEGAAGGS